MVKIYLFPPDGDDDLAYMTRVNGRVRSFPAANHRSQVRKAQQEQPQPQAKPPSSSKQP